MTQMSFCLVLTGDDRSFRVRTAAMLDLYTALGRASRCLQNLQLLPWERQKHVKNLLEELDSMTHALPSAAPAPSRAAPLDSAAIFRELQRADPEEMAERWPNLARYTSDIDSRLVRLLYKPNGVTEKDPYG